MKRISILCPSRQRCERAYNYALTVFQTATEPQRVELLFYLDNDDPELEQYQARDWNMGKVDITVGEPMSVSKSWNIIAAKCSGDIMMMGNDDQVHATNGWDVVLDTTSNEYPDDIYCIHFNDGIHGSAWCAFPAVSRLWYDTLGYFAPGHFEFLFNDTWAYHIARKINRLRYVSEILIKHEHFTVTGVHDVTTMRHFPDKHKRDKELYYSDGMRALRNSEAQKLAKVIADAAARKQTA